MIGRMPWDGLGVGKELGMIVCVDAEGAVEGRREGIGVGPAVVTAMLPSSAFFKFLKLGDPSPDAGSL